MNLTNIHELMHDLSIWVVIFLVLGAVTSVYIFYKLFEHDLFSAD